MVYLYSLVVIIGDYAPHVLLYTDFLLYYIDIMNACPLTLTMEEVFVPGRATHLALRPFNPSLKVHRHRFVAGT